MKYKIKELKTEYYLLSLHGDDLTRDFNKAKIFDTVIISPKYEDNDDYLIITCPEGDIADKVRSTLQGVYPTRMTATECRASLVEDNIAPITPRQKILENAIQLICKSRQEEYGPPSESFAMIANLWDIYLKGRELRSGGSSPITPGDVAIMNILQKIVRLIQSPDNIDSWTDIAGYAALGGECVQK